METATQTPTAEAQQQINGALYERADLVSQYKNAYLNLPEAAALIRYRDDYAGRAVLDLGCGAGRLAAYLTPHTDRYVGFDISPHMLEECRRHFPNLPFVQGDMRDLSAFDDGEFSTVFAIFNLFDAVGHADRLRVLAEVRRILNPCGLLIFSAHNRNYAQAAEGPRLQVSRNPITQVRWFVDYVHAHANHRRIRRHQRFESDYALLNDSGHNYSVLHYYIGRDAQARQLEQAGFQLLECLDESGRTLAPQDDDRTSSSIHYVARKTC